MFPTGSSVAALVGFEVSDGLEVAEDVDLIFVCVEVISDVTPQQEAQVAVTSIDDSAVSASTGIGTINTVTDIYIPALV